MAHLTAHPSSRQGTPSPPLPGAGPPPGTAPPPVEAGPGRPRHSRALWIVGAAVLAVLSLVAGVTFWALWVNRAPAIPTGLTGSSTAVSVDLAWTPGDGDVTVEEYLVLRDGDVVPACQQTCPTEAIVFGDLNDPDSRVSKLRENKRAYDMLAYLNIKPRTSYLARIRNPNPELAPAEHGDHPADDRETHDEHGASSTEHGGHAADH